MLSRTICNFRNIIGLIRELFHALILFPSMRGSNKPRSDTHILRSQAGQLFCCSFFFRNLYWLGQQT